VTAQRWLYIFHHSIWVQRAREWFCTFSSNVLSKSLLCAEWKAVWAQISKVGLASDWKNVFSLPCQYLCNARQNESTAREF